MGTTLQNGVYLPNEGERNCYAGLKTNWEILDQKVADVTALQQAVAGALHREIVESLPTTDINPNTIYMILSGTSATENVYNEYMHVNNAWELIGTSATDLTNYYTKAEVDGKLLLKANASDLTSHTGDTTIHVTTADKNKWNNQTYVFRYSSTALVASSTNSNTLLDNTDNLKVGDKVIDSSGVLFSITAIDIANSTFTIGTALIDLAQDSDVVHTSGNETVGGVKTFTDSIQLKSNVAEYGVTGGSIKFNLMDKNSVQLSRIDQGVFNNGISYITLQLNGKDSNNQTVTNLIKYQYASTFDNSYLLPTDNSVWLGSTGNRFGRIYGILYYYGSNNVEFSTKFVTTDTNQTVSGKKTFSDDLTIYNSDSSQSTKNLNISSSKIQVGDTSNSDAFGIRFNAGLSYVAQILAFKDTSGTQNLQLAVRTKDSSNNFTGAMIRLRAYANGFNSFESDGDNLVSLGSPSNKWKNVQTYKVNNLEPSSLSLPSGNLNDVIDISSYFANTGTGEENRYTASANGWIYLRLGDISSCQAAVYDANINRMWGQSSTGSVEQLTIPILKGQTLITQWNTSSSVHIAYARFIPCQGNV